MNLNQSPLVRFHFVLGLVLLLAACADEVTGPDTTPPRAISDLRATYNSQSLIALVWTAPGDDGDDGTASEYDLRISTSPITAKSWGDVERVEFSRTPGTPGTSDFVSIDGLEPESEYYVGIRTADDVPNWSSLSNVPLVKTRTGPDETPPSVIEDLVAVSITEVSITLEWTAPGNDGVEGTSSSYDIRHATDPITESNWKTATRVENKLVPKLSGETESLRIEGLAPATTYFVAIQSIDGAGNLSSISSSAAATTGLLPTICTDYQDQLARASHLPFDSDCRATPFSEGPLVYVVDSWGLFIYDYSDPFSPFERGRVELAELPRFDGSVFVMEGVAYVRSSGDSAQIHVVDVSDPARPKFLSTVEIGVDARAFARSNEYLVVAGAYDSESDSGLLVLDVADREQPRVVGEVAIACADLDQLVVSSSRAFVTRSTCGIYSVDLSSPSSPRVIDQIRVPSPHVFAGEGDRFVDIAEDSMTVFELSSTDGLEATGSIEIDGVVTGLEVSDRWAFIASQGGNQLRLVDLTNPELPAIVRSVRTASEVTAMSVEPTIAYLVTECGLQALTRVRTTGELELGKIRTSRPSGDFAVRGYVLHVVDGERYSNYDIRDPAEPVFLGVLETPGDALDVAVRDNYAYIADGRSGLLVVDIADPSRPTSVGHGALGRSFEVELLDQYAIVGAQSLLNVVDVTDPQSPTRVSEIGYPGDCDALVLVGFRAYVSAGSMLRVVSLVDPRSPVVVNQIPASSTDLVTDGRWIFAVEENRFFVIDGFDESGLEIVSEVPLAGLPDGVRRLAVRDEIAYLTSAGDGILMIDVADPEYPVFLQSAGQFAVGALEGAGHVLAVGELEEEEIRLLPFHCR